MNKKKGHKGMCLIKTSIGCGKDLKGFEGILCLLCREEHEKAIDKIMDELDSH